MLELLAIAFGSWPSVAAGVEPTAHLRWKMSSPAPVFAAFLGEAGTSWSRPRPPMGYRILLRGREAPAPPVRRSRGAAGVAGARRLERLDRFPPAHGRAALRLSIIDAQSPIMIQRARSSAPAAWQRDPPSGPAAAGREFASAGLDRGSARLAGRGRSERSSTAATLVRARRRTAGAPAPAARASPRVDRFDDGSILLRRRRRAVGADRRALARAPRLALLRPARRQLP